MPQPNGDWSRDSSTVTMAKASCALASERGLTGDAVLLATTGVGAGNRDVVGACCAPLLRRCRPTECFLNM